MKNLLLIIFFLFSLNHIYSQDVIVKKDGTSIKSKVEEIGVKEIKYYKYDNLNGPIYSISKKEVVIINFADGTFELISSNSNDSISMEETKNIIIEYINQYAYAYSKSSNPKKKYKAYFEDDYLRIKILNKSGTKESFGILWDFSVVYEFGRVKKRKNDMAIFNLWVSHLKWEKRNVWDKNNLEFTVKGHDNADIIYEALKRYNRLFLEKKGQIIFK